jgi:hypothetical protein
MSPLAMKDSDTSLALFDKGGGNFTGVATTAASMLGVEPNSHVTDFQPELCEYDLVIAHILEPDWKTLIDGSDAGAVRLRVSTAGFPESKQPHRRADGVCIFHLVPSTLDLQEDHEAWNQIIEGLSDESTVSDLIAGEGPNQLASFFSRKEPEILSALSILCQGYLAVHAEAYHEDEDSDEQEGSWEPEEISGALNQMGWTEDHLARTANGQAEKATQLDWWRSSFDDMENLIENAEDEWGDAEGWSAVKNLLEAITDEESNEETRDITDEQGALAGKTARQTASNAYLALEKQLRGKS